MVQPVGTTDSADRHPYGQRMSPRRPSRELVVYVLVGLMAVATALIFVYKLNHQG